MASEADPFAVSAILTSTVSAKQMAEYKAAFEAVDADHSGRIAAGEIQASARGLGHDVSDEEAKELIARCAPPDLRSSCVSAHTLRFSASMLTRMASWASKSSVSSWSAHARPEAVEIRKGLCCMCNREF